MVEAICSDCKGIALIGGAEIYSCMFNADAWNKIPPDQRRRIVEERFEIECDKFEPASREMRVKMKEMTEMGITTVFGGGTVQIPAKIREILAIKDGDKILWIRKGGTEFVFRKVGYKPAFKPHYV